MTDEHMAVVQSPAREHKAEGRLAIARHLSLDVVLGSVCVAAMALDISHAALPAVWWFLLPAGVWLTYTLDHLLDAARVGPLAQTARHRFHALHFRAIRRAAIAVFSAACLAALFLPADLWIFGLAMIAVCGLHLWLNRRIGATVRPWLTKELAVAFVYAAGIFGGPLIYGGWTHFHAWLTFFAVLCLASANLIFFARMEIEADRRDGHSSLAQVLGPFRSDLLAAAFCLAAFIPSLLVLLLQDQGHRAYFGPPRLETILPVVGLMSLTLLALIFGARRPFVQRHYRALGDAVFLFPALIPLLEWLQ